MSDRARCDGPVLIVEDDAAIRESLQYALEDEGYAVVTAENGEEGLDRLRTMDLPCLVLLDLMMPVMSGGEFLASLRGTERFASIPVVVVSAWPSEAAQVRHETHGFVGKPISLDLLLEMVDGFCLKPRSP